VSREVDFYYGGDASAGESEEEVDSEKIPRERKRKKGGRRKTRSRKECLALFGTEKVRLSCREKKREDRRLFEEERGLSWGSRIFSSGRKGEEGCSCRRRSCSWLGERKVVLVLEKKKGGAIEFLV